MNTSRICCSHESTTNYQWIEHIFWHRINILILIYIKTNHFCIKSKYYNFYFITHVNNTHNSQSHLHKWGARARNSTKTTMAWSSVFQGHAVKGRVELIQFMFAHSITLTSIVFFKFQTCIVNTFSKYIFRKFVLNYC